MEWWRLTSWLTKSAGNVATDAASTLSAMRRAEEQARVEAETMAEQQQQAQFAKIAAEKERMIQIAKKAVEVGAEKRAKVQLESYGMVATPSEILKQVNSRFTYAQDWLQKQNASMRQKALQQVFPIGNIPTSLNVSDAQKVEAGVNRQWARYWMEQGNYGKANEYLKKASSIEIYGFPKLEPEIEAPTTGYPVNLAEMAATQKTTGVLPPTVTPATTKIPPAEPSTGVAIDLREAIQRQKELGIALPPTPVVNEKGEVDIEPGKRNIFWKLVGDIWWSQAVNAEQIARKTPESRTAKEQAFLDAFNNPPLAQRAGHTTATQDEMYAEANLMAAYADLPIGRQILGEATNPMWILAFLIPGVAETRLAMAIKAGQMATRGTKLGKVATIGLQTARAGLFPLEMLDRAVEWLIKTPFRYGAKGIARIKPKVVIPEVVAPEVTNPIAKLNTQITSYNTRIAEIDSLLSKKGRLPVGMGTRADLGLERAELDAAREIADTIKNNDPEFAVKQITRYLDEHEQALGGRTIPYGAGNVNPAFRGMTTAEIDAKCWIYKSFLEDAEKGMLVEAKSGLATELHFNPKNLIRPTAKTIASEAEKVVKRSAIAKELSDRLAVTIRRGHYQGKVEGIYKINREIIRFKKGDIQTISHEVGHFLDEKIPKTFSTKINSQEASRLLAEYAGKKTPGEAFSEFVRFYVTEPTKAKIKAFNFYKYFERTLEGYPEVRDALLTARADYERWLGMPATAKISSQILLEEETLGVGERMKGGIHKFLTDVSDDLHPLKQFMDVARQEGMQFNIEEDPYIWARLLRGNMSKANLFLDSGTFGKKYWKVVGNKVVPDFKGKGLTQILKPISQPGKWQDFNAYLVSRRAIELGKKNIATGIAEQDAKIAIRELESKYAEFPKVAQELYGYQRDLLKYVQEMGLISEELFNKLAKYEYYVPFHRVMEGLQARGFMGKKLASIASPLQRIRGSEREIINPLESIIKNTHTLISTADRNQVGILMANLADKNPELAKLFEKIPTPMSRVAQVTADELGIKLEGLTTVETEKVFNIFRPSMFSPENIVTVLMNGQKQHFMVDPDLYKGLLALDTESIGMIVKMLSYPAKWLRAGATLSPDFALARNPIRDAMTAFCYSKYGFLPPVDFIKGLASVLGKDSDYLLYRASGADHAMMVSLDRQYLKKSFAEIVEGKKFTQYVKNPMEALRTVSEWTEKSTRMGEFKLGLKQVKNPIEAGLASREVTLDFSEIGAKTRALNNMIAFFNANIRGWARMGMAFKEAPLRTSLKVFTGITLPSILLYAYNRNDPRYKEIPQWQKDLFWIVMTDDTIYRIPKPFELGLIFGSGPERFLEYLDNKDPKMFDEYIKNAVSVGSPGFLPTALLPVIEGMTNYSFFLGRPIVPVSKQDLPKEMQYTEYTSETSKQIGELLNLSPAKIDNTINGWTGGLGRYAVSGLDGILKGTGISSNIPEPSPTLADRPVIKALVVRSPYGSSGESVNRFYEILGEYTGNEQALKEYVNTGQEAKFEKYKSQHPELLFQYDWETGDFYSASARYLRSVSRDLAELRKKEDLIYADPNISSGEKRRMIDEIDKLKTEIAVEALANLGE